jgi:hypothetical protein
MGLKYQMTRHGMQSMYTLAWRGLMERGPQDPMFSSPDTDVQEPADADEIFLEAQLTAPGRLAPLEDAVRSRTERERLLARREAELLRLGYTGF